MDSVALWLGYLFLILSGTSGTWSQPCDFDQIEGLRALERPAIYRGGIPQQLRSGWTPGEVEARFGLNMVQVAHSAYYPLAAGEVDDKMLLKDYMATFHNGSHTMADAVVFDTHILHASRSHQFLSLQQAFPGTSSIKILSIGGLQRSGFGLHAHGHSVLALHHGRKQWIVYPGTAKLPPELLDPLLDSTSIMTRARELASSKATPMPLTCTQEPGDIVFIPAGYPHATLNLDRIVIAVADQATSLEGGIIGRGGTLGKMLQASLLLIDRATTGSPLKEAEALYLEVQSENPHELQACFALCQLYATTERRELAVAQMDRAWDIVTQLRKRGVPQSLLTAWQFRIGFYYNQVSMPEQATRPLREAHKLSQKGTLLHLKVGAELGKALFLNEIDDEAVRVLSQVKSELESNAWWDHLPLYTQGMLAEMMPQLGLNLNGINSGDQVREDL